MDMTSWCAENAVESKLEACIERIRVSCMWYIFEGLEKGSCTIKVTHDGDRITFASTKTKKQKIELPAPVPQAEPIVVEATMEPAIQIMQDTSVSEEAPSKEDSSVIIADPTHFDEAGQPIVKEEPKPTADVSIKLKPRRSTKK